MKKYSVNPGSQEREDISCAKYGLGASRQQSPCQTITKRSDNMMIIITNQIQLKMTVCNR